MTRFIILRHGNTIDNNKGIFTGTLDTPLSTLGEKQINSACEYIYNNFKVDKIYSSFLSRAINSVKPLAERLNKKVNVIDGIEEMFGGKWQGMLIEDIKKLYPEDYKVWQDCVGLSKCTDGESFKQVQDRATNALKKVAKDNPNKVVVISTHGGLIRALECAVKNIPLKNMDKTTYVVNASISLIDYVDDKFVANEFNINHYLDGLQTEMPKGI